MAYTDVEMKTAVTTRAMHCGTYGKDLSMNVGNKIMLVNMPLGLVNETMTAPVNICSGVRLLDVATTTWECERNDLNAR